MGICITSKCPRSADLRIASLTQPSGALVWPFPTYFSCHLPGRFVRRAQSLVAGFTQMEFQVSGSNVKGVGSHGNGWIDGAAETFWSLGRKGSRAQIFRRVMFDVAQFVSWWIPMQGAMVCDLRPIACWPMRSYFDVCKPFAIEASNCTDFKMT